MNALLVSAAAIMLGACAANTDEKTTAPLPEMPSTELIAEMTSATTKLLGDRFVPVFVCGPSTGQAMLPEAGKPAWHDGDDGPVAIVLVMDQNAAFDVVRKEPNGQISAAAANGGTTVPTLFDPVSGDISLAVLYTATGHSETFLFSTYGQGPSFLTWTRNVPQNAMAPGGRGVGAYIAQCVELAVGEAP